MFEPRRLVARDPQSGTGEAIRVVGYSAGMDRVLVVVLVPGGHPPGGYSMLRRSGRRIAACVACTEGRGARMAGKECAGAVSVKDCPNETWRSC
jgi:hypothetical protein